MPPPRTHLRSRPIAVGKLRAFEAVARHLNFSAAFEELSLTQSAVSRQIQSLESDVGVSLFLRHTRAVELTGAGVALVRTPLVAESLASGDLVEPFPTLRLNSPLAYWLIVGPRNAGRPEVAAFCDWLRSQAVQTRAAIGEAQATLPSVV